MKLARKTKKVPSANMQMALWYTEYYAHFSCGTDTVCLNYTILEAFRQC